MREALDGFNKAKWKVLGEELGLREDSLEEIKNDYQQNGVRERLNQVLAHWLRKNYDEERFGCPTWQNLANAVTKSGDRALADTILAKH